MSPEFYWIAFAAVLITSASRITRLATYDEFPPAEAIRNAYGKIMVKSKYTAGWVKLAFCGYCFSFWATLAVVVWADLAGVLDGKPAWGGSGDLSQPLWWIINGTFGASYLAAILMANDGDES